MHVQRTILEGPRQQNAPADPICSPSRFALSPSHKSPVQQWQQQRVNDSLCFVAGNRTKANDNNKSIKLSGSEHISTFLWPTRGLKCTYCTPAPPAPPPPGSRRPRDSKPLSGQGELDKWLEQTSLARDDSHRRSRHHCKLHHPNSIILFMPTVVDTEPCDWRHALHRLIGILNWKTAGEEHKYRHPEDCHNTGVDKGVNFNLSLRHEVLTMLKSSSEGWKWFHLRVPWPATALC